MLDPQTAAVALIMRELDTNMGRFRGRMKLQKYVYLLEEMGAGLGFHFSWYIRGPYCPPLADIGFQIEQEDQDEVSTWTLHPNLEAMVIKLRSEVFSHPDGLRREDWAEVLASLSYLAALPTARGLSRTEVERELLRRKPHLDPFVGTFSNAWQALARLGLSIPAK